MVPEAALEPTDAGLVAASAGPPRTRHMILGAGDGSCTLVAVGAREHQTGDWGAYVADQLARCHGVSVEEDTTDATVAYARFPGSQPTRYPDGLLPDVRDQHA